MPHPQPLTAQNGATDSPIRPYSQCNREVAQFVPNFAKLTAFFREGVPDNLENSGKIAVPLLVIEPKNSSLPKLTIEPVAYGDPEKIKWCYPAQEPDITRQNRVCVLQGSTETIYRADQSENISIAAHHDKLIINILRKGNGNSSSNAYQVAGKYEFNIGNTETISHDPSIADVRAWRKISLDKLDSTGKPIGTELEQEFLRFNTSYRDQLKNLKPSLTLDEASNFLNSQIEQADSYTGQVKVQAKRWLNGLVTTLSEIEERGEVDNTGNNNVGKHVLTNRNRPNARSLSQFWRNLATNEISCPENTSSARPRPPQRQRQSNEENAPTAL